MQRDTVLEATLVAKYVVMAPLLNERTRRLWAAAESVAIGFGGDAVVSAATGLARKTIRDGRLELAQGLTATDRIRRPGAGRPDIEQTQPGVTEALDLLVEPLTRGDPMSPLRWTCKSTARLAGALTAQGWPVSATTVGKLLHGLGYRLHALQKAREGAAHPDRNAQFEYINACAADCIAHEQPVISVDTKKKELVGDFKNAGRSGNRRASRSGSASTTFPTTRSARRSVRRVRYGAQRSVGERGPRPRHPGLCRRVDSPVVDDDGAPPPTRRPTPSISLLMPAAATDIAREAGRRRCNGWPTTWASASMCRTSRRARASGTRSSIGSFCHITQNWRGVRCAPSRPWWL